MARKRTSSQHREREFKKRERQHKKREKAAQKRGDRENRKNGVVPPPSNDNDVDPADSSDELPPEQEGPD